MILLLYTTTIDLIWLNCLFVFILRGFTKEIWHLAFRNYSHFNQTTSIFRGSIDKKWFDQVQSISTLLQDKWSRSWVEYFTLSQHVRHVTLIIHHSNELKCVFKEALPSQVLLSVARWRPGGHIQCTSPLLAIWQPNWQRREKHVASAGKQTGEHWLRKSKRNRPLDHCWESTLANRTTTHRTWVECPQHWDTKVTIHYFEKSYLNHIFRFYGSWLPYPLKVLL